VSCPVPSNETERLKELARLRADEWGFSAALDRLCAIAIRQLGIPVAQVSLVGDMQQRFAARRGLDASPSARETSLCAHAIMRPGPFIVENAAQDPRFADNPDVIGGPGIMAYAGIPLETAPELRVGAFCAIDLKPRHFTEDEIALLCDLGAVATQIIDFHLSKLLLDSALTRAEAMQDELREHTQAVERSNRELADFAQILSHDLKAPIRTITTYLPEIRRGIEQGDISTAMEDYGLILKSATHMSTLIDTLRDYCKVRYREATMTELVTNVVVDDALAILTPAIDEKAAIITCGRLPAVIGNAPQLVLLFQNLVGNALKFCDAWPPRISIEGVQGAAQVEFTVRDNGIGIKAEQLDRIFEPFHRLHAPSRYAGVGLGLAICRKIVERHKGRIWCTSTLGEGSAFHFTLPAAAR
jgi:signal transduction histidine kinase